ncbi:1-aminocyclopropane-1-carboxylate oxidase homolog 4 [Linum perenne]
MATSDVYDRQKEVRDFEESKHGVKGLVDTGLSSIPRFFIHNNSNPAAANPNAGNESIPTIDLSGERSKVVEQVSDAARRFGFFQIVNHGIPIQVLDSCVTSVRGFHELPTEEKEKLYGRQKKTGVSFFSNLDLFRSQAACWADALQIMLTPKLPDLEEIPEVCRSTVIEWNESTKRVGELVMELLCEGLGLDSEALKKKKFLESRTMVGAYYPYCPQPELTVGIAAHTDAGAVTLLLQDEVGGLQVLIGENWVDVVPVQGALVVNIGDLLQVIYFLFQIMSNDEYKSVKHRVRANPSSKPRVSVVVFFHTSEPDAIAGPFPELISDQKPAVYRQFRISDYMNGFYSKELGGGNLTNFYKV